MRWRTAALAVIVVAAGQAQVQPAQPAAETAGPARSQRGGWHLYSATAYTGYMSLALPDANFNYLMGAVPLGSDIQAGGSLSLGWTRFGRESSVELTYDPSYTGMVRHTEWNALNHALTFRSSKRVGNKWNLAFSAAGSANNMNQFLFTPTALSNVAAVPATIAELAGAMLAGQMTNPQLASVLTGASVLDAPTRAVIYGNRVLSTSATTSVSYEHSRRLSLHFAAGASRNQYLNDGQDPESARYVALVPRTTGVNASAGFSYSLTPRTDFGLEASGNRTVSSLQDMYRTNVLASLGRRLGRRWLVQGRGGAAWITSLRETYQVPQGAQYLTGGTIGYRTAAHSFMATADRTPMDNYGVGAGYTLSAGGTWRWHRVGSAWEVSSSVRQQRMHGTVTLGLDGWMCTGGVARTLGRQMAAQLTYSYLNNTGTYLGAARDIEVHAVQLAIGWREEAAR
jgi:hypothetical protein